MDWSLHIGRILARLGEDVTFTHGTAQGSSVRGMFLSPYALLPGGFDAGFASSLPRFAALSAALPSVALDDTITRSAVAYKVVDIQPDDPAGLTVLALQKAS